jgi:flagellar biosynthetic protein FliR
MLPALFAQGELLPDMEAWTQSLLLGGALAQFYAFSLVLVRMSGLLLVGPLLGQSAVPAQFRVLIAVTCAFLVTPSLSTQADRAFASLDRDRDGRLAREEVPGVLLAKFESINERIGHPKDFPILRSDWRYRFDAPQSLVAWGVLAVRELCFGLVLGLGMAIVFSGLQLAGELIDQQTGIGLSGVFNPGLNIDAGVSGQALYMFGITVFLTMPPVAGHLLVVSALLETFQAIPIGEGFVTPSAIDLLSALVHQSLVLGIQIAAPVLVAMAFTGLTMGFLSHTVPQINVLNLGFPIRAIMNVFILSLSLSGAAYLLMELLPAAIERLRLSLLAI